ncbi:hypothetical protein [Pseudovibrio sp. Ad13]|uniref:hypothetical protein n=1 Tax=Pseudovibrio sp. Ad13 TaxID=989396 RepID=UPI0007AEDEF6|nr:hypothetical protein [Pseudovibrio sp. Ad13]
MHTVFPKHRQTQEINATSKALATSLSYIKIHEELSQPPRLLSQAQSSIQDKITHFTQHEALVPQLDHVHAAANRSLHVTMQQDARVDERERVFHISTQLLQKRSVFLTDERKRSQTQISSTSQSWEEKLKPSQK